MTESKIDLTERLRAEDRWAQASRFKDETIAELRQSGVSRKDAASAAWEAMAEKYPPLPQTPNQSLSGVPPLSGDDVEEIQSRTCYESFALDMGRDAGWVYDNLDVLDVPPVFCPSTGAWGLLHWARQNRSQFYEKYWHKFAPREVPRAPKPAKDPNDATEADWDLAHVLAEEMIHAQDMFYSSEIMEDSVVEDFRLCFFQLQRYHDLELPREARKDLEQLLLLAVVEVRQAFERNASGEKVDFSKFLPGGPMASQILCQDPPDAPPEGT